MRCLIESHFAFLRVLDDEDLTEDVVGMNSIVNLIVYKKNGEAANLDELRLLHKLLSSIIDTIPCSIQEQNVAKLRCLTGQPVKLGDKSVIRLALGASQISAIYDGKCTMEDLLSEDFKILAKLQWLTCHLDELC